MLMTTLDLLKKYPLATDEEIRDFPHKNVITRALGMRVIAHDAMMPAGHFNITSHRAVRMHPLPMR